MNSIPYPEELLTLPSDQDASGRTFGAEELRLLTEVIESGTLTSTKGNFVKTLEQGFARLIGARHAFACASGSAAIHTAIAAIYSRPRGGNIPFPLSRNGA